MVPFLKVTGPLLKSQRVMALIGDVAADERRQVAGIEEAGGAIARPPPPLPGRVKIHWATDRWLTPTGSRVSETDRHHAIVPFSIDHISGGLPGQSERPFRLAVDPGRGGSENPFWFALGEGQ